MPTNNIITSKPKNKIEKNIKGRNKLHGSSILEYFSPAPVKRMIEHFENIIFNSNSMDNNFVMLTDARTKRPRLSEPITCVSTGLENEVSLIKVHQQGTINTGMF